MKFIFEEEMKSIIKISLFILLLIILLLLGSDLKAQVKVSGLTETTSLNDSSLFAIQVDSSSYKVWRKFTGSSLKARSLEYIYPMLHFAPIGSQYQLQTTGIADNAVTLDKLDQTVIDFITGTSGTNPDTGNVRTTGDYIYGAYRHYGVWHQYGSVVGYSSSAYDLSLSDYFRLPINAPALYGYTIGSLWYTTGLNRGIFLRNNSGSNDTIPSLALLREIYGFATDTNKVTTTGDDYIYGNLCSYGWHKFSGGIRLPQTTSQLLSLEGEIWFNPTTQNFYGLYDEDDSGGASGYFIQNRHLSAFAGSANITTLGTITSGTWNGGTITIGYGGTGATNKTTALNNLLPTQTTRPYKFLRTDGATSNWYDVYYLTYALNLDLGASSIDLREHQQNNLFVTCTPDQSGNTIGEILGNKHDQIITLHNSFDATANILINDGNNLILGDVSQDTLSPGESKTLIYNINSQTWTALGVTNIVMSSLLPDDNSFVFGEGQKYNNSIAFYDSIANRMKFMDNSRPEQGTIPYLTGGQWDYPTFTGLFDGRYNSSNADKPDSLHEIIIPAESFYFGEGYTGALAFYGSNDRVIFADELEPQLGDIPVFTGDSWTYSSFASSMNTQYASLSKYSKSSYLDYPGYNETVNDSVVVFQTRTNIYIDSILAVVNDSSFTFNYYFASQRDSLNSSCQGKVFTSDQTVTNKTTGTVYTTTMNSRIIPKGRYIALAIRGKAGKTNENFFAEIFYREY